MGPAPRGLYRMEPEHYHKSYGYSKSMLDDFEQSPSHMIYRAQHPEAETEAMRIGHWTHIAVLEPHIFDRIIYPIDLDRKGTKAWDAEEKKAQRWGAGMVKRTEYDRICGIARAVRTHKTCQRILSRGTSEVSVFVEDDDLGLSLRARPDWLPDAGNSVVDLKTCESARRSDFERHILNFRYHVQAAFYLDALALVGVRREFFVFIAVEKEPPHAISVFQLSDEAIEAGRRSYKASLERVMECEVTGNWPSYPEDIQDISIPDWSLRRAP
jgi:hypothetical protein